MKKSNILMILFAVIVAGGGMAKAGEGAMGNLAETNDKISLMDTEKEYSKAQTVLDNFYTGDISRRESKAEPVNASREVQGSGQTCPGCGASGVAQYTENKSAWDKIKLDRSGAVPELSPFNPVPQEPVSSKKPQNNAAGALALGGTTLVLVGGKKLSGRNKNIIPEGLSKETSVIGAAIAGAVTGAAIGAAAGVGVGAGPGAVSGAIIGGMGAAVSNVVEAISQGVHGS